MWDYSLRIIRLSHNQAFMSAPLIEIECLVKIYSHPMFILNHTKLLWLPRKLRRNYVLFNYDFAIKVYVKIYICISRAPPD